MSGGRHFEQWAIGDRIDHVMRRTVTETDNLLFSTMTHNPQPLHLDAEAARAAMRTHLSNSRERLRRLA